MSAPAIAWEFPVGSRARVRESVFRKGIIIYLMHDKYAAREQSA
jgi:hypothetical protein